MRATVRCGIGVIAAACLQTVGFGQTLDSGTIKGRVLDADGRGVQGVRVLALHDGPSGGPAPMAVSAPDGSFVMPIVQPGTYQIHAAKEEDGYPDTSWGAVANDRTEVPTVTMFAGYTADVTIRLGPPTGVLRGRIVDDQSRPVIAARVLIVREDAPDAWVSTSVRQDATFVLALPDRFYRLDIDAPGFESWSSEHADEVSTHHVRLGSGETVSLTIHLRRVSAP